MKIRDRIALLSDWARRDPAFGLAQARQDDAKAPGLLQAVQDQLALREEFGRRGSNPALIAQILPPPKPIPLKEKKT